MSNYDIESKGFALSPEGVHLLRKRFNYKTIDFSDIHKANLTKAADTKNIALTAIAGVLLVTAGLDMAIGVYKDFTAYHFDAKSGVLPVLPLLLGLYCIYIAVKKVPLLIIDLKNEKHKLGLQDIIDAGRITFLENYLKEKLRDRFYDIQTF